MPLKREGEAEEPLHLTEVTGVSSSLNKPVSQPSVRIIALAAFAAFLVKIALALRTYGTNDVYTFEKFWHWSQYLGVGLYRVAWDYNHPPFMLHMLRAMGWLAEITQIPFSFWLRVPGIVADPITLLLVWKTLGSRAQERSVRWALLLLAIAPPLILVSGFHGNTDTIMVMFLVLTTHLIEKGRTWLAGAAFALAMSFKVVPVLMIPVILLNLGSHRRRLVFFGVAGTALLLLWSPYVFQDPFAVVRKTIGYRSLYGQWGLSYLAERYLSSQNWINRILRSLGAYLLVAAIARLAVWMNHIHPKPSLFSQMGFVFFFFMALSNGFGVQYLTWLVPWAVGLGAVPVALYYLTSGAFLLLVYNYWSEGFPWYLADSNRVLGYQSHLAYFQLLCWLTVVYLLVVAWKQIQGSKLSEPGLARRIPDWDRWVALPLCALLLMAFPVARHLSRDSRPHGRREGDRALRSVRARQSSEMSSQLYAAHRYPEAISTSRQALALDPTDADAYSSIAASSAALGLWDQAIENAQQALRIQPDSSQAQQALARARERQRESHHDRP